MPTDPRIAPLDTLRVQDPHWIEENLEIQKPKLAQVPPRYRDARADHPEVVRWVQDLMIPIHDKAGTLSTYCPKFEEGESIFLLGPTGTGKTWQAYGAFRALVCSGARGSLIFTTAPDLYSAIRPGGSGVFETYAKAAVLFLDDIGAAKESEWTEEINYRLINYRYEHMLPTCMTSNTSPSELIAVLGQRVMSRIAHMSRKVVIEGKDRRVTG